MAVVVGGAEEKTVVDVTLAGRQLELLVERLERGGLRHGVGHVEVAGDAACGRRLRLGVDVGLGRQSRLAEVYVVVDDARQYKASRGVNRFID